MKHVPKEMGDGARWTGHLSDLTSRMHQSRCLMVVMAFGSRIGSRATHGGERMVSKEHKCWKRNEKE